LTLQYNGPAGRPLGKCRNNNKARATILRPERKIIEPGLQSHGAEKNKRSCACSLPVQVRELTS
jgi:hypothetical protein